jgi:cytochrome c oxidase subunit 4
VAQRAVTARMVLGTYVTLMALAGLSLGLSFVHLGAAGAPVALAIAGVKAALVGLVFMELLAQGASSRVVIAAAVFMLVLLATLTAADVLTRETPPMLPHPSATDHPQG